MIFWIDSCLILGCPALQFGLPLPPMVIFAWELFVLARGMPNTICTLFEASASSLLEPILPLITSSVAAFVFDLQWPSFPFSRMPPSHCWATCPPSARAPSSYLECCPGFRQGPNHARFCKLKSPYQIVEAYSRNMHT